MGRYDIYVEKVEVDLTTGLLRFIFDRGHDPILIDRGELAELLLEGEPNE